MPGVTASATSGPPIISINGDNPATIQIGTTYVDLGALIIAPQQDLNLGLHFYIDGAPQSIATIDTSKLGTQQVDYVVTDQRGLTSTSTRTVIVSAPAKDNAPASATSSSAVSTTTPAITPQTTTRPRPNRPLQPPPHPPRNRAPRTPRDIQYS